MKKLAVLSNSDKKPLDNFKKGEESSYRDLEL